MCSRSCVALQKPSEQITASLLRQKPTLRLSRENQSNNDRPTCKISRETRAHRGSLRVFFRMAACRLRLIMWTICAGKKWHLQGYNGPRRYPPGLRPRSLSGSGNTLTSLITYPQSYTNAGWRFSASRSVAFPR